MQKVRLDHIFVLTPSEAQALIPAGAGFTVVRHGPHQGGGTGNVVYQFRDTLLECAYPLDSAEIAALGEIGFAERWRWRETGYSPFGVVFQVESGEDARLPFETWEYRPPFLPDAVWTIGRASPHEPLYMVRPYDERHQSNDDAPLLTSIRIRCAHLGTPSPVARFLEAAGLCSIVNGRQALMELTFAGRTLPPVDLRPECPLTLQHHAVPGVTEGELGGF